MHVGFVPKPNELDLSPQQLARHVRLITPEEAGQFLGTMGPEGNVGIVKGTTVSVVLPEGDVQADPGARSGSGKKTSL